MTVDHEAAVENAIKITQDWAEAARCADIIVTLTGPNNFRKALFPEYKANRKGTAKPAAFATALLALKENFETVLVDGLEADDLMGILHTGRYARSSVIVTLDKDLLTIPGRHFNPNQSLRPFSVDAAAAHRSWMYQTLMGDRVDGIPGIPKVGPKTAEKILEAADPDDLWAAVLQAYETRGHTEADAIRNARLTRILHNADYDWQTKEVKLWHPIRTGRLLLSSL